MDSIIFLFQVYVYLLCDIFDLKMIFADEMTECENLTDPWVAKLVVLLVVVDQFTPVYLFTPTLNFLKDSYFSMEKMFTTS